MSDQNDVVTEEPKAPVPGESSLQEQLAAIKPAIEAANGSSQDVDPIEKAKQLVVDNYNKHRNPRQVPAMTPELVVVLWFTGTRKHFRMVCEFTVVQSLRYEVSYNGRTGMAFIDVYKKYRSNQLENV
jgi:hypothetical protein